MGSAIAHLAASGLYGAFAPANIGGTGLDATQLSAVVEVLASGCLATAFVWAQHFALLGAALDESTPETLRRRLLPGVVNGRLVGGVSLAGLLPGPARLRAEEFGSRRPIKEALLASLGAVAI